jgi:hypothetical protein
LQIQVPSLSHEQEKRNVFSNQKYGDYGLSVISTLLDISPMQIHIPGNSRSENQEHRRQAAPQKVQAEDSAGHQEAGKRFFMMFAYSFPP